MLGGELEGLGRTLVQGAGAGRLAYDLHARRRCAADRRDGFQSAAVVRGTRAVCRADGASCTNIPIAPRRIEDHAVLRRLSAPAPARAGLELVAADALQPPFADGAFDTVVTPWFIDIIGEPFARVAARINLLLKPGGRWINFGSLAFARAAHAERVSLEEVTELMPQLGFADFAVREGRCRTCARPRAGMRASRAPSAWVANKMAAPAEIPRARVLPEWLLHARQARAAHARARNAGDFEPRACIPAGADQRRAFACATWRACSWSSGSCRRRRPSTPVRDVPRAAARRKRSTSAIATIRHDPSPVRPHAAPRRIPIRRPMNLESKTALVINNWRGIMGTWTTKFRNPALIAGLLAISLAVNPAFAKTPRRGRLEARRRGFHQAAPSSAARPRGPVGGRRRVVGGMSWASAATRRVEALGGAQGRGRAARGRGRDARIRR